VPSRDWPLEKLADATLEQASSHFRIGYWGSGSRSTVQSMFKQPGSYLKRVNISAFHPTKSKSWWHPSVNDPWHFFVGFNDGAFDGQHIAPDMRHAIGFALHTRARTHLPVERLDLAKIAVLNFVRPMTSRCPLAPSAGSDGARRDGPVRCSTPPRGGRWMARRRQNCVFANGPDSSKDTMETLFPDNGVIDAGHHS